MVTKIFKVFVSVLILAVLISPIFISSKMRDIKNHELMNIVEIGQIWVSDDASGNLFEEEYRILSVRDGWVQYERLSNGEFKSIELSLFVCGKKKIETLF